MNVAVILASGMGKRMGAEKNKVLLELGGKPLIFYAIDNFEKCDDIDHIILVVKEMEIAEMQLIVDRYDFKKVAHIVCGGQERQHSGHNGVRCVNKYYGHHNNVIVLFHNGANPFVENDEIQRVVCATKKHGAAVVAHKTKDTVRRAGHDGLSQGVIDRLGLWHMQTPQAIQLPLAVKVFDVADKDGFLGTDDVSLVERLGGDVVIVEASDNNFKVTTPIDLALARVILERINMI